MFLQHTHIRFYDFCIKSIKKMICWTDFFKKMSKIRKENLSLSGQEVPELHFGRFLALVFATRVLQNDMVRQALGAERAFQADSSG